MTGKRVTAPMAHVTAAGALALLLSACYGSDSRPPVAGLPVVSSDGSCGSSNNADVCGWLTGSDAVLFGRVTALEAIDTPLFYQGPDHVLYDDGVPEECVGSIHYGLRIMLDIEHARGLAVGESAVVSIGSFQTGTWLPFPQGDEGPVTWYPSDEGSIVVGQQLGAAVLQGDDGTFFPAGEGLFAELDGVLVFQQGWCLASPPNNAMTVEELFSTECVGTEGAETYAYKQRNHNNLAFSGMAECSDYGFNGPDPECGSDLYCPPGEVCVDGFCRLTADAGE